MPDLAAQIEERRRKLQQLKLDRERNLNKVKFTEHQQPSNTSNQWSLSVPSNPIFQTSGSFLYPKNISTLNYKHIEPDETSESSYTEAVEEDLSISTTPPQQANSYEICLINHIPPNLKTFLEDSLRTIIRFERATPHSTTPEEHTSTPISGLLTLPSVFNSPPSVYTEFSIHEPHLFLSCEPGKKLVELYNLDMSTPEFSLHSPLVTTAKFSNTSAHLVYTGNKYGQISAFDLHINSTGGRYQLPPVMKSHDLQLSAVLNLHLVSKNTIISIHSDKFVVVWLRDTLSAPQHVINLEDQFKQSNMLPMSSCLYEPQDYGYVLGFGVGICFIGLLNGQILRLPSSESDDYRQIWQAHDGPVCAIDIQPDLNDSKTLYVLSGGVDWCLKLWKLSVDTDQEPQLVKQLPLNGELQALKFLNNHQTEFIVSTTSKIEVWDLETSAMKPKSMFPLGSKSLSVFNDLVATTNGNILKL